ncbi:hypothetical protein LSH36_17g09012 [Paralvinella palmiformis]|uniref:Uncharacterized protein n=1 Tax=Paralvinella palmiformis TaxID=53620 RepID=A0AAD9KC47_9ANNE|nr:hypothetical protein LSH36_17g09012 [Paralvinella palmiformis]
MTRGAPTSGASRLDNNKIVQANFNLTNLQLETKYFIEDMMTGFVIMNMQHFNVHVYPCTHTHTHTHTHIYTHIQFEFDQVFQHFPNLAACQTISAYIIFVLYKLCCYNSVILQLGVSSI